ncbi:thiolase family protein [Mycobacterium vicinigordonae]
MTAFGKWPQSTIRELAEAAVAEALGDAAMSPDEVGIVFFGNAVAGLMSGQEMIRGQAALRRTGLLGLPIVNVENACASASTALNLAVSSVASGAYDVAIAVGAEKLTDPDKTRAFDAIGSAVDLFELDMIRRRVAGDTPVDEGKRSFFMDVYASIARDYMRASGATAADFAEVVVKSHYHGALNPKAQYRRRVTAGEVLSSRVVTDPLTLLMCSPIGDGAAAVVVCSPARAARRAGPSVRVRSTVLTSGTERDRDQPGSVERAAVQAYEAAGIGPYDLDVIELHDAAAPAELVAYEELGLCAPGGGPGLLRSGRTRLGGSTVVNPSGGLLSKGHPIGATGCAQIVELADQLRGRCGARQVEGARVALAQNAGGYLGADGAAAVITILST